MHLALNAPLPFSPSLSRAHRRAATLCTMPSTTHQPFPARFAPPPKQLGGSGVLVQPMTYIFDEEPERWKSLLVELGIDEDPMASQG